MLLTIPAARHGCRRPRLASKYLNTNVHFYNQLSAVPEGVRTGARSARRRNSKYVVLLVLAAIVVVSFTVYVARPDQVLPAAGAVAPAFVIGGPVVSPNATNYTLPADMMIWTTVKITRQMNVTAIDIPLTYTGLSPGRFSCGVYIDGALSRYSWGVMAGTAGGSGSSSQTGYVCGMRMNLASELDSVTLVSGTVLDIALVANVSVEVVGYPSSFNQSAAARSYGYDGLMTLHNDTLQFPWFPVSGSTYSAAVSSATTLPATAVHPESQLQWIFDVQGLYLPAAALGGGEPA